MKKLLTGLLIITLSLSAFLSLPAKTKQSKKNLIMLRQNLIKLKASRPNQATQLIICRRK